MMSDNENKIIHFLSSIALAVYRNDKIRYFILELSES